MGKPKLRGIQAVRQIEDSTAEKRKSVSNDEFVTAWESSTSIAEVAKRLGLKHISVYARGRKLVKAGVALKRFARQRQAVDVDALNGLIRRAREEANEESALNAE